MGKKDGLKSVGKQAEPPSRVHEAVNLLANVDINRDRVGGEWSRAGELLRFGPAPNTRMLLPYLPPEDYALRCTATRLQGMYSLVIGLVVEGRLCDVTLNGWNNESGLESVDGLEANKNETVIQRPIFRNGQPCEIECIVRGGNVTVICDGRQLIGWQGASRRLGLPEHWRMPRQDALFLGGFHTTFEFSRLEVVPTGRDPGHLVPPGAAGPIDLLASMDLERDRMAGEWTRTGRAIDVAETRNHPLLQLAQAPPEEYDLTAVVERRSGSGGLTLGLVGRGQFALQLDAAGGFSALESLDGRPAREFPGRFEEALLVRAVPSAIVTSVRRTGVTVTVDGREAIRWQGAVDRLALPQGVRLRNPRAFFLAASESGWRFYRLTLQPR